MYKSCLSTDILKFPYSLQEVAVRILHNQACNQKYRFLRSSGQKKFIGKDMLCGGSEWGLDTCQVRSVWAWAGTWAGTL